MEKKFSRECSIIAYFFAKYDEKAIQALGYKNYNDAFTSLSILFEKKASFIRNRRDEFDAIVSERRKGWYQRPPAVGTWNLHVSLKALTYDELLETCQEIIAERNKDLEDNNNSTKFCETSSSTNKKRIKITDNSTRVIKLNSK